MISDSSLLTALTPLKSRHLFDLAMKLLNLPTNGTLFLRFNRRILSQVVGYDVFRALCKKHKPEQFHSMSFGEVLQVYPLPTHLLFFVEVELRHALVWVFAV